MAEPGCREARTHCNRGKSDDENNDDWRSPAWSLQHRNRLRSRA